MIMKYYSSELYHHGIQGQKWGVRRYQNEDGTLTAEGRIHYGYGKALDSVSGATSRFSNNLRSKATDRNRRSHRIGNSIRNELAYYSDRVGRTASELKRISDSDDSFAKKALKTVSTVGIPTKRKIMDQETGATTSAYAGQYGSKQQAIKYEALRDRKKASEQYRWTKGGRYLANIDSINYDTRAKYYNDRYNSSSIGNYISNFGSILSLPYVRSNGKETTFGREYIRDIFTLGIPVVAERTTGLLGVNKGAREYEDKYK